MRWPLALAMMVGAVVGGYGAARLSRRVNQAWVRVFVVVIGVGMGTYTLVKSIRGGTI